MTPDGSSSSPNLLREQMADGGWNCQRDRGAVHSSFHTTANALDGLQDHLDGDDPSAGEVGAALARGREFGEIALLDNGPRTATVVAETDLVAEVSSHREFVDLLNAAPNLARNLLIGLAGRLRTADLQLTT